MNEQEFSQINVEKLTDIIGVDNTIATNATVNMDKFKMELVWHNCKTCPPEELFNDELIATNGVCGYVLNMTWDKRKGFFISINGDDQRIQEALLEDWWWADIQQTAQNEPRFKK